MPNSEPESQEEIIKQPEKSGQEEEEISAEIADFDIPDDLPPEVRKEFKRFMLAVSSSRQPYESPIQKKINERHIDKVLDIAAKETQLEYETSRNNENTKRLGMGALLVLVSMVFIYAGWTKDKDLSEKVMDIGAGALGGFGAGVIFSRKKEDK